MFFFFKKKKKKKNEKKKTKLICGSGKTTLAKLLSPHLAFCNNGDDKLIKYRDKEVIFAAI